MSAVIYCRVSTKEQTRNLSLGTQKHFCRDYCEREGLSVAHEFVEAGESAKTADRTELKRLLEYCRRNKRDVTAVVVYNVARFSRDTNTHTGLRTLLATFGVSLRSVTEPIDDTPSGKMIEGMLAVVAQFENDQKADRTKVGMDAALQRGRWTFRAPLGYRRGRLPDEPSLVPDGQRATFVRLAFKEIAGGRLTETEVLGRLTGLGLRRATGKAMPRQTFHKVLRNPIYSGRMEVKSFGTFAGDFEPLVDPDTFQQVQTILTRGKVGGRSRQTNNPDFPLRQFLRCAACRTPLTGSWSRGRSKRYAYYHCRRCRGVRQSKHVLEDQFVRLLKQLQPDPNYIRLFLEVVADVWKTHEQDEASYRSRCEDRISTLQKRQNQLEDAWVYEQRIDKITYERQQDTLREEIALARIELNELTDVELEIKKTLAFAEDLMRDAARMWTEADSDQKQRLQHVFFPEGLAFEGEGFGTAVTCLAFRDLGKSMVPKERMASPRGIEPLLPG